LADTFEPEHPDWNTVEVLAARVDELMVLVGAVRAALIRTRTAQDELGTDAEALTEDDLVRLLQDLSLDMDYVRAVAQIERNRASDLRLELGQAQDELTRVRAALESTQAQLQDWKIEAANLQAHRDELREELISLQTSRWMTLGRKLGAHRQ